MARSLPRKLFFIGLLITVFAVAALASGPVVRVFKVRSLEKQCKEALQNKDWDRLQVAAAEYRSWVPHKAAPIIMLAEAHNQQGQLQQTVDLLKQLPDSDPMTPPALVERSSLLFGPLNQPLEAAETLERALRLDPRIPEARRRLIYFYAFTLQRRKMVSHAQAAIQYDCDMPETYVYLVAQDWLSFSNAYDENTRWLTSDPNSELFLVARAIYRVTTKALDEISDPNFVEKLDEKGIPLHRRKLAEYFQRFPRNPELLAYYLRESTTNGDAAETARLLALVPPEAADDNRFWRFKGWLHNVNGELEEAENSYRRALTLNPYDYVSQHQFAAVKRRRKQFDQVKMLEDLAREGQLIRREILQLKDVTQVPHELMARLAKHAAACGDTLVATHLSKRIEEQK